MKKIILLTFLIIGFLAISTVNAEEIANGTSNLGIEESNALMGGAVDVSQNELAISTVSAEEIANGTSNLGVGESNALMGGAVDVSQNELAISTVNAEEITNNANNEIMHYKIAFFNNQTIINLDEDDINWNVKSLTEIVEEYGEKFTYEIFLSTFEINNVEYIIETVRPTGGVFGDFVYLQFNPVEYDVYDGIFYKVVNGQIVEIIDNYEYKIFDGKYYKVVGIMGEDYLGENHVEYYIINNECYKFSGTDSEHVVGFFTKATKGVDYKIINGKYYTLNGDLIEDFSEDTNDIIINGIYYFSEGIYYNTYTNRYSIAPYNYVKITNNIYRLISGKGTYNKTEKYGDETYNITKNNEYVLINNQLYNFIDGNIGSKININNENSNLITIRAPNVTKYYGGNERFTATIMENDKLITGGYASIKINNVEYTKLISGLGEVSLALNLNAGQYKVITKYKNTIVNSTVTIKPTITANNLTKIYKNGTQYYATFTNPQGNLLKNTDVKFNINGVFYTRTTNDKGIAKMNINLNPGTYILTAENPLNGEQHGNTITVLPNIVENHDLTKYYKNNSQYRVRLLDNLGRPVSSDVAVIFNINGVFYSRITDANGYAKLNINLNPGEFIITAQYNDCFVSNRIKVLPILSANDLTMSYKDGSKFAVKLLDGQGKPFAGQDVTMNINGVFYDRVTDDSGVARLNINLLPNEYIITSSYNGFSIGNKILIKASNNQQSNPAGNPTNNPISNSTTNTGSNTSFVPYDLDKAIIVDINTYNKYITKYSDNYKLEAYVYQNSNTGIDISLSNRKISGTGAYDYVNKNYYVSSIYSNMTGTWQWNDWKVGEGVSASTIHKYSYGSNNFAVTKVAVKIIDGLSDDGYSFYPTDPHMPDVDSHGITREYAIAHNMHYIQGDGDWSGGYVNYDAVNKCYHA